MDTCLSASISAGSEISCATFESIGARSESIDAASESISAGSKSRCREGRRHRWSRLWHGTRDYTRCAQPSYGVSPSSPPPGGRADGRVGAVSRVCVLSQADGREQGRQRDAAAGNRRPRRSSAGLAAGCCGRPRLTPGPGGP